MDQQVKCLSRMCHAGTWEGGLEAHLYSFLIRNIRTRCRSVVTAISQLPYPQEKVPVPSAWTSRSAPYLVQHVQ